MAVEDRKFRSVSLNMDLLDAVESELEKKKSEVGEALLPPDFKSVSAFIAESTRLRIAHLKGGKD